MRWQRCCDCSELVFGDLVGLLLIGEVFESPGIFFRRWHAHDSFGDEKRNAEQRERGYNGRERFDDGPHARVAYLRLLTTANKLILNASDGW